MFKSYFLRLAYIWLVRKLDNSIILNEAKSSRATSISVCKIELLFVSRDIFGRDVFAVCLTERLHVQLKDNVFRRLIFIAFAGRHCGGHLSLSAYKFHYPARPLPDVYTGAPGREMSSREMSFCSEQLHLVIYNTLVQLEICLVCWFVSDSATSI